LYSVEDLDCRSEKGIPVHEKSQLEEILVGIFYLLKTKKLKSRRR
jgi:hypothetical protein